MRAFSTSTMEAPRPKSGWSFTDPYGPSPVNVAVHVHSAATVEPETMTRSMCHLKSWDHSLVRKRRFHPVLRKLGIPQCGFHAFRHGNATLLDQIGAPIAVRLNRLGQAEAQTTMGYTHAVTADERRTAEELGKILHATARNEQRNGQRKTR